MLSRWLRETTMTKPAQSTSKVSISLPSDEAVRRIMGKSYSPEKTLIKMFAGTEDMFEATIGLVKAIFKAEGIEPKTVGQDRIQSRPHTQC
jgi:hypothetical protein